MHSWEVVFQSFLVLLWTGVLLFKAFGYYKQGAIYKRAFLVALILYAIFAIHLETWWSKKEYVAVVSLVAVTIATGIIAFQQWRYRENAYESA